MASLSPGGTVALGVIVGLISTCVQSVGLTLQRKSHMLEDEKEEHVPRRAPYRRRRWQIGMLLFLLSNIIGSSIQITTLPLPLLSTLQASGLVFNALLASLLLQEPFTRRTAFGTILVAGGAVLISVYSALPEPSHTLDQLLDLLVVPNFIVWMSMTFLLVILILVGIFCSQHFLPLHQRHSARFRLARGMSYGLISGILSAHSLLLAKSAVELLVRTISDHKNQFNRYQSWILLLLFLFLALTQLYYLHHGLKLVTTSILYPFVFCIYNIIAILDGLIYFRQMDRLPPLHAGLIALGTVILLTGVLALSWRLSEDDPEVPEHVGHGKVDLPQSALTPGMGFVDDNTANDASIPSDEDDEIAGEYEPLLRRHTLRDSALMIGKQRRRRRSTLREVENIWDELRDEEGYYGTLQDGHHSALDEESGLGTRTTTRRLSSSGIGIGIVGDDQEAENIKTGIGRSKTAPAPANRRRKRGRSSPFLGYTGTGAGFAGGGIASAVNGSRRGSGRGFGQSSGLNGGDGKGDGDDGGVNFTGSMRKLMRQGWYKLDFFGSGRGRKQDVENNESAVEDESEHGDERGEHRTEEQRPGSEGRSQL